MNVLINRRNNRRHAINREHPDRSMPRQFKIVIADRIKGGEDNFHAPARESAYHKLFFIIRKVFPLNLEKYYEIMKSFINKKWKTCKNPPGSI